MTNNDLQILKQESPIGRIFDFPEMLQPMLVKELRQGLRGPFFAVFFIVMQAILGFSTLLTLHEGGESPEQISLAIFAIYIIAICGLQPLRGINAISSEVSRDTIDLLMITKLSAWKIVFGKWFSIMGQSFLFSVSLLPYLILRYFLGDMQLVAELTIFCLLFIVGGISTAITVGCSAISSAFLRYIVAGGLALGFLILILIFLSYGIFGSFIFGSAVNLDVILYSILGFCIVSFYLIWMLLDFGASTIAPVSENRSTLRRLIYFGMLVIAALVCGLVRFYATHPLPVIFMIQMLMMGLFIPFFITTFTESAYLSLRIVLEMRKRRIVRIFKNILYPGWAPGSLFLTLCIVLHFVMMLFMTDIHTHRSFIREGELLYGLVSTITATLVFSAAAVTLFAKNRANRQIVYLIIFLSTLIFSFIVFFLANEVNDSIATVFCWVPSVNLYNLKYDMKAFSILNTVLILVYGLITLFGSRSVWRQIYDQELAATEKENRLKNNSTEKQVSSPE
jgi:hypothetical protein